MRVPDRRDLHELVALLIELLDMAQQLAPSQERKAALKQIEGFQRRLGALLIRAL